MKDDPITATSLCMSQLLTPWLFLCPPHWSLPPTVRMRIHDVGSGSTSIPFQKNTFNTCGKITFKVEIHWLTLLSFDKNQGKILKINFKPPVLSIKSVSRHLHSCSRLWFVFPVKLSMIPILKSSKILNPGWYVRPQEICWCCAKIPITRFFHESLCDMKLKFANTTINWLTIRVFMPGDVFPTYSKAKKWSNPPGSSLGRGRCSLPSSLLNAWVGDPIPEKNGDPWKIFCWNLTCDSTIFLNVTAVLQFIVRVKGEEKGKGLLPSSFLVHGHLPAYLTWVLQLQLAVISGCLSSGWLQFQKGFQKLSPRRQASKFELAGSATKVHKERNSAIL